MPRTEAVSSATRVRDKKASSPSEVLVFPRSAKGNLVLVNENQRVTFLRRVLSLDYLLNGYDEMVIEKLTSEWHLEKRLSDSDSGYEYGLTDGKVTVTSHCPPAYPDFVPFENELKEKYQIGVTKKSYGIAVVFIPKDLLKGKKLPQVNSKDFFQRKQ